MFSMAPHSLNYPTIGFNPPYLKRHPPQKNIESFFIGSNKKQLADHAIYFNNRTMRLEKRLEQRAVNILSKNLHYFECRSTKINSSQKYNYWPLSFDEHSQFIERVLNAEELNTHQRVNFLKKMPVATKKAAPNKTYRSEPIHIKFENLNVNIRKNLTRESFEKSQASHQKTVSTCPKDSSMYFKQRQYIKV